MQFISETDKALMTADFDGAVASWLRPLTIWQEPQKVVVVSDVNYNPIEAYNQNNTEITNVPVFSSVSGRILWNDQQDWKYVKPYQGRGANEGQLKVKDQTTQSCRLKVDPSGYNLLLGAKKVQIDGVLMDPESQPRPHGLFWPTYYTFYFVRSM